MTQQCIQVYLVNKHKDVSSHSSMKFCCKGGIYSKVKVFLVFALIVFVSVQVYVIYEAPRQQNFCNRFANKHRCHPYADCVSTATSFVCICKVGYFGDGVTCRDVDECKQRVDTCAVKNMKCKNTIGGYKCYCPPGFYLLSDDVCLDVDECESVTCPRDTQCVNSIGSYACKCKDYHLLKEGRCQYDTELCRPNATTEFPHCQRKYKWMKQSWKSHPCYAKHGVTGSDCTVLEYLAVVENQCPPLPGKTQVHKDADSAEQLNELQRFNSANLFKHSIFLTEAYVWIRNRIASLWNSWVKAYKALRKKQDLKIKTRKRILIFIGFLADNVGDWNAAVDQGGIVQELVQWADLIVSVHLLGHQLYFARDVAEIMKGMRPSTPCNPKTITLNHFDLVYIDIRGLQLLTEAKIDYVSIRCKLRVLDSFGTEARFNYNKKDIDESEKSLDGSHEMATKLQYNPYGYGGWNINLKQFMTMFPHSPDNSFLGFSVRRKVSPDSRMEIKEDIAMLYGKDRTILKGTLPYLLKLKKYFKLHGTVLDETVVRYMNGKKLAPEKVPELKLIENHKELLWSDYQNILKKAKVFVGLGYPFEGVSPLEAIANGAVFLNVKFDKPLNRLQDREFNSKWNFEGKPSLREFHSQHTYMEKFIGKPLVYTINITDNEIIEKTINEIIQNHKENNIQPHIPYEFTQEGFLQRMRSYIEHQDFCDVNAQWPGINSLKVVVSRSRESCADACYEKGLVCDNALFNLLNDEKVFEALEQQQVSCVGFKEKRSLLAPYYDSEAKTCTLQKEAMLFSCVDRAVGVHRVCPCREYIKGQVALCPDCL